MDNKKKNRSTLLPNSKKNLHKAQRSSAVRSGAAARTGARAKTGSSRRSTSSNRSSSSRKTGQYTTAGQVRPYDKNPAPSTAAFAASDELQVPLSPSYAETLVTDAELESFLSQAVTPMFVDLTGPGNEWKDHTAEKHDPGTEGVPAPDPGDNTETEREPKASLSVSQENIHETKPAPNTRMEGRFGAEPDPADSPAITDGTASALPGNPAITGETVYPLPENPDIPGEAASALPENPDIPGGAASALPESPDIPGGAASALPGNPANRGAAAPALPETPANRGVAAPALPETPAVTGGMEHFPDSSPERDRRIDTGLTDSPGKTAGTEPFHAAGRERFYETPPSQAAGSTPQGRVPSRKSIQHRRAALYAASPSAMIGLLFTVLLTAACIAFCLLTVLYFHGRSIEDAVDPSEAGFMAIVADGIHGQDEAAEPDTDTDTGAGTGTEGEKTADEPSEAEPDTDSRSSQD